MDRSFKILIAIWAGLVILTIGAMYSWTAPREITENIWLPDNYHFVNEKRLVKEIHISGTAVIISFDEYKKQFSDSKHEIILTRTGGKYVELHYLTKDNNITYSSFLSYSGAPFNFEVEPRMITDSEMRLSCSPGEGGITTAIVLTVIAAFVSLFLGLIIADKIDNIIEKSKYKPKSS